MDQDLFTIKKRYRDNWPRCGTCKYWYGEGFDCGVCLKEEKDTLFHATCLGDCNAETQVSVDRNFGCIHHEEKGSK
jgi:hypothetical protein